VVEGADFLQSGRRNRVRRFATSFRNGLLCPFDLRTRRVCRREDNIMRDAAGRVVILDFGPGRVGFGMRSRVGSGMAGRREQTFWLGLDSIQLAESPARLSGIIRPNR
jgi:hypothetical protein